MDQALPSLGWGSFFGHGDLRPVWTVLIAVALAAYVVGVRRLRRRGESFSGLRVSAFVAGALVLAWSLSSGVQVYASTVFWMHMVQHLLLIMVVPSLLVLGHPLTVLARATPGDIVVGVLRSGPVALVTHPLVGFAFYGAVIVGTHLTGFMDQMMTTAWLAPGEQSLYLLAGYLFLLPLLGDEPVRWHPPQLLRVFLLVVGMVPDTVVGIVLLQTGTNLFPAMLRPENTWAPDPVQDIHIGGGLMWALGDGLMMVFAVGLVVALIARPGPDDALFGSYLEGVRRSTMRAHVELGHVDPDRIGRDADVDGDADVLAAYNAMLERMNHHGH